MEDSVGNYSLVFRKKKRKIQGPKEKDLKETQRNQCHLKRYCDLGWVGIEY